jgi:prevent-host-death family protein
MQAIGVRELRQQASRYLRAVELGETIEVTDHGRPVAWLVPVPRDQGLSRLVASGRADAGAGDALDLGPPLEPRPGTPLASQVLASLREHER